MLYSDANKLRELFKKRMDGVLSATEEELLEDLLSEYSDEELSEVLEETFAWVNDIDPSCYNHDWEAIRQKIVATGRFGDNAVSSHRPFIPLFLRYAAAAALIIAIAGGLWYLLHPTADNTRSANCGLKLPSKQEGDVIEITMVHDKVTFAVPRSWQYELTLPDGSQVWLNASSSITYPRSFNGNSREVTIEGEVSFSIDTNTNKPFYVTTRGKRVEVPAGSFNVNAYEEQVVVSIDTVQSQGWKQGYFAFREANVKTVVSELARWYDWKVVYDNDIKAKAVTASFCRNTTESGALKVLRSYGIAFRKQGNEIIIL